MRDVETSTVNHSIAERARAAYRSEKKRAAAQQAREIQERRDRLGADLDKHLAFLGITKEECGVEGYSFHFPYGYPNPRPDYAFVTIDGMAFARGDIWGLKDAFVVSLPCRAGDGQPRVNDRYAFTGAVQDYLRQLGKWVEEVFDNPGTMAGYCTDCLTAISRDDD